MASTLKLDSAGIREVLKSQPVAQAVGQLADQVRASVESQLPPGVEVVAHHYQTDRAAASVTIKDIRGRLWQVRDGVLTRAAAGAGLEVRKR